MKQLNTRKNLNNKGFSLVEILVTITILVILGSVLGVCLVSYIEKARRSKLSQDAQTLLDVAQVAIADAASLPAFTYTAKYRHTMENGDTVQVARFTNKSLYQYTNGITSSNLSAAADYAIAEAITTSIPGAQNYARDVNPIDDRKSTLYIANHPEEFGKFAFAFTYDSEGAIVYFEVCYNGYFFKLYNGEQTIEKVRDDLYFEDWPVKAERINSTW